MVQLTAKAKWTIVIVIVVVVVVLVILWIMFRSSPVKLDTDSADIVIVGAGTCGCILARRLSEQHPGLKVVVLERGISRRNDQNVFNLKNMITAGYSKPYSEVLPTDFVSASGMSGVIASVATMYGGGSSHNFGLAVRGSTSYYNGVWKDKLGLSYEDTLAYMKKVEAFHPEFSSTNNSGGRIPLSNSRFSSGLIQITPLPTKLELGARILPALGMALQQGPGILGKALLVITNSGPLRASNILCDNINSVVSSTRGVDIVEDYNTGVVACISSTPQLFVDSVVGIRQSTDVKYLPLDYLHIDFASRAKTLGNPQLQVVPNATVTRIVNDGVEWTDENGATKLISTKRTIMCTGGIYTPYLLLKSGYTPPGLGENLRTHYGFSVVVAVDSNSEESFMFSGGPVGFLPRGVSKDINTRDWQLVVSGSASSELISSVGGIPNSNANTKTFSFILWLLNPRTRGNIQVGNNTPTINLRMFEDGGIDDSQSDISNMLDGLHWITKMLIPGLQSKYNTMRLVYPPQSVIDRNNKQELVGYVRGSISLTDHYSNTCELGKVVDPDTFLLSTIGVTNLLRKNKVHVVDCSVLPLPDGNTNYPAMVLAEVAAERIGRLL